MDEEKNSQFWKVGFLTKENFRDFIICLVLIVLAVKVSQIDVKIDFAGFNFTDLLSMLLAFFATALSAAFYFKANESSNVFYNNTYKFTKDVSEILGRIEAGFGERLKHIDESYVGLSNKIDKFDVGKAREEQRKEEEHIKDQEVKRDELVLSLMERAKIAGEEKAELLDKLHSYTAELERSREELRLLQEKIEKHETLNVAKRGSIFKRYFDEKIKSKFEGEGENYTILEVAYVVKEMLRSGQLDSRDRRYMVTNGLIDRNLELTPDGVNYLRKLIFS